MPIGFRGPWGTTYASNLRLLGNDGPRAPAAVAPGVEPMTPYFLFEPQHMERMPAAR